MVPSGVENPPLSVRVVTVGAGILFIATAILLARSLGQTWLLLTQQRAYDISCLEHGFGYPAHEESQSDLVPNWPDKAYQI
jgi:hypothetical protein